MKKYLLTALLGVFALFTAFASADTVDNFTSSSDICKVSNFEGTNFDTPNASSICGDTISYSENYYCIVSSDNPYYIRNSWDSSLIQVDSSYTCFFSSMWNEDDPITFFSDSDGDSSKTIQGTVYISTSEITYSSSSGGGSSSGSLLPDGVGNLSGIISSLSTTLNEFIPYLVYVGLGIISALIGFVAIKRLINWIRAKIFSSFSSGRRRR